MAETIYLLLGSNEGDRLRQLKSAAHYLVLHLARGTVIYSSVYETAAWGKEDQPSFLHPPELVLAAVHQIEQSFGRQRTEQWGQRTLDVDILFYGNQIIQQPGLIIPHPQLQERRFALIPMAEIAPELHKSVTQLLHECSDVLPVQVFEQE